MAKKFGIAASESAVPYVISTGIRDVFIGLTFLILYYKQDWGVMGAVSVCVSLVPISDFLVVRRHGDRIAMSVHLAGAIGTLGYGLWLLAPM